jgi:hypothetical protein
MPTRSVCDLATARRPKSGCCRFCSFVGTASFWCRHPFGSERSQRQDTWAPWPMLGARWQATPACMPAHRSARPSDRVSRHLVQAAICIVPCPWSGQYPSQGRVPCEPLPACKRHAGCPCFGGTQCHGTQACLSTQGKTRSSRGPTRGVRLQAASTAPYDREHELHCLNTVLASAPSLERCLLVYAVGACARGSEMP